MAKPPKAPGLDVYTLVVRVGRRTDDGLPNGASGATLLCYASGRDEQEAVRETIHVLKQASMAPLEVESLGSRTELGTEPDPDEAALMQRAADENAVIVAQVEVER